MPLIHRILYAIRTLTEDESPQPRRKQETPHRNSSRHKQAVNMVLTFRDLFASGGLNFLLEDNNQSVNRKNKHNHSSVRKSNEHTPNCGTMSPNLKLEHAKKCVVDLPEDRNCLSVNFPTDNGTCIPFKTEHLVAHPSANFSIDSVGCTPFRTAEHTVALVHEQSMIRSPELDEPLFIDSGMFDDRCPSTSKQLEVFGFRMGRRKRRKAVTVPLCPDDENKTVATLRKVLKWSPTKQNLTTFAVSLPKEEEHKVVAVVQNAVNRVKEEEQRKKKRKLKLFKLTFC